MISSRPFGRTLDGSPVTLHTLRSPNGELEVDVADYGGVIDAIRTSDRNGRKASVVLGFNEITPYLAPGPYFGAVIGRYANRIGGACFELDGTEYRLEANEGRNQLHGGSAGFHTRLWDAEVADGALVLRHRSPDGWAGFPGNLDVTVAYSIEKESVLVVDFKATTDRSTHLNLTCHPYFNLSGDSARTILDHQVRIAASCYTPVDDESIPTGEIRPVQGTPFDLRIAMPIGSLLEQVGGGFDHNFVLDGEGLRLAAVLTHPETGREMEIRTTEPGIQFYSGNSLDGSFLGTQGHPYRRHVGLCLETQHFPDSPNRPAFPSTILRPGHTYRSRTTYEFRTV